MVPLRVQEKRYAVQQPPAAFLVDLGEILQSQGICDLVGLQTYTDGVIGLESTDYETNVSTTVEQGEEAPVPAGMEPTSLLPFTASSSQYRYTGRSISGSLAEIESLHISFRII